MGQEKKECTILELPPELINLISLYAAGGEHETSRSNLAISHTIFGRNLFQKDRLLSKLASLAAESNIVEVTNLLNICPGLRVEVLFTLAGLGAQDEMETLLQQNPEDLLVYGPLRDISGAVFGCITLFQHTIWTKDVRYMANMMLDCLPHNEHGELIRLELVRQYEEHMNKGVAYQLKEIMINERHFNLEPLKTAHCTYEKNYDNWTEEQRENHWCTVIGFAQNLLPAHIRHHYCDPEEDFWDDNLNFNKPKLKRSLQIYNSILKIHQLWSTDLDGLGRDYGIYACYTKKGLFKCKTVSSPKNGGPEANSDALWALEYCRTEIDLPTLVKRLYTPIQNLEHNPKSEYASCFNTRK